MRGRFVTFEGGEGSGKSTQVALLAAWLREGGATVVTTREPGGTPGAEQIRGLLVEGEPGRWDAWSEALLVYAARRDHVQRVVLPALASGAWVLCDRFADSTLAYQGVAGGLGTERVEALHRLVLGRLRPDLTFILDLPAEAGLARARSRESAQRFENFDLEFHRALRRAFLDLAAAEPERCCTIDAMQSVPSVAQAVLAQLRQRLGA